MKKLFAMVLALASLQVFAVNTYNVKDYTCSELKTFLREEGVVRLRYRLFGSTALHYQNRSEACRGRSSWDYEPRGNSIYSGDRKFCFMGYRCYKVERDRD